MEHESFNDRKTPCWTMFSSVSHLWNDVFERRIRLCSFQWYSSSYSYRYAATKDTVAVIVSVQVWFHSLARDSHWDVFFLSEIFSVFFFFCCSLLHTRWEIVSIIRSAVRDCAISPKPKLGKTIFFHNYTHHRRHTIGWAPFSAK